MGSRRAGLEGAALHGLRAKLSGGLETGLLPEPLARAPKAELHVHLPGCVRAGTLAELSERHGVALPLPARELYARVNSAPSPGEAGGGPWFALLRVYELICRCLQSAEDFARVAYEALEDAYKSSNVVHQELAFSPSVHMALGTSYPEIVLGLADGLRAAATDFGVTGGFIAAINREDTAAAAREMVQTVLAHRVDEVIAVGLDFDERKGPPERFAEAFQVAGRAGLHRTAHAGEHVGGPQGAANVATCLDLLGCDRIDHGYYVLEDRKVLSRCRDEGVPFNVVFTTSRRALRPWRRASVRQMMQAGLKVNLSSDDPSLFPTTVASELAIAHNELRLSTPDIAGLVRNGVEASFMSLTRRRLLLAQIEATMAGVATGERKGGS